MTLFTFLKLELAMLYSEAIEGRSDFAIKKLELGHKMSSPKSQSVKLVSFRLGIGRDRKILIVLPKKLLVLTP